MPLILLSLSIMSGCNHEDDPELIQQGVIEGTITNGGYPDVIFSKAVIPGNGGNLSQTLINWGKVTVSDGEKEVILTGRVDDTRLPPFRYYSYDIQGEPGKTYTLRAEYEDILVESECRLPYPTSIDSVTFAAAEREEMRAATLHFTSPPDVPAYYYLTMAVADKRQTVYLPCLMGTVCADRPRTQYSVPVLRPRQKLDTLIYAPHLRVGEMWAVRLNRIEKEVYDFWSAYDNMLLFSNSPFITTDQNLPTNIRGGSGVWSAQGSDRVSFTVR